MKNSFLWHDAKIEKPATSDPMLCLTSNGYITIAQYNYKKSIGQWEELARGDSYDNVVWWSDFKLPRGWKMSDDYYPEER